MSKLLTASKGNSATAHGINNRNTLDEQITINDQKARLLKYIEKLENMAWIERQPQKKFELAQEIRMCKNALEDM